MFELTKLQMLIWYRNFKRWLIPPVWAPTPWPKTFNRVTFLGRSMVMDLDPRFVMERALLAKVITDHLESREHFGFICEKEKENWYAALGKVVSPLRDKVKTKAERRKTVEEMKAQRLNGHANGSKSAFSQLKDSLQCTKA